MDKYTRASTINRTTRELVKIRVSQINGCPFCLDSHTSDARKMGETEQRIYCLDAWEKCSFYTPEEKVALELSEHMTSIAENGVPEELYNRVRKYYDEKEYTDLVLLINHINSLNLLAITMGDEPEEK
ncbi:hypothetical protein GCM10007063_34410 [Lentibacillus kapialis]|uniref:Carboxymuconolactone decarboxylase-like domain-containing protein n=1 Tax=Lentibacillus kapialis TaxID=340214 RepID=A0A917Q4K3_9BACI|nr:carboxymuconolactone decarboxylase family protein [Lentibacillus kapialis]GGK09109.1 hypothetical protein GCM10007063_34410 [Lentibacillus kapialis]